MTPRLVYMGELGFFFTPIIGSWKVAFNSGCVTFALRTRSPIGRMKRSNLGGFRVNVSPTKHILVTMRFQALRLDLPVRTILKASDSAMLRTLGSGTSHLP
ncbi:putative secreted peptide [Paragonimus kellicotti]|nr:putative secreted peptide [Paragonimus kellicotti]